ncbi:MAG: hypothetical protein ACRCVT_01780 [Leadbetterella sp.]
MKSFCIISLLSCLFVNSLCGQNKTVFNISTGVSAIENQKLGIGFAGSFHYKIKPSTSLFAGVGSLSSSEKVSLIYRQTEVNYAFFYTKIPIYLGQSYHLSFSKCTIDLGLGIAGINTNTNMPDKFTTKAKPNGSGYSHFPYNEFLDIAYSGENRKWTFGGLSKNSILFKCNKNIKLGLEATILYDKDGFMLYGGPQVSFSM